MARQAQPGHAGLIAVAAELETELLDLARRAALAAGVELLARRGGPLTVQTKSTPTDPVSEADIAAERAIRGLLTAARPQDSILGEEGGATAGDGALRWVVDPLDGTVNYLYGLPAFVVSVAVEDDDGGLAAVIHQPSTGDLYLATRSGPALYLAGGGGSGEPLLGSGCGELERALVATGFAYDSRVRAVQGRVVSELVSRTRDIRRAGAAALDLAWVAAGRLDAYYERDIKPWDVAAGTLLCERAGLAVRRLEPRLDDGSGVALPGGVIAAPPALIDELGRTLASAERR